MKKFIKITLVLSIMISMLCLPSQAKTSPFCTLNPEDFTAESIMLIEPTTGTIVFEKNADKQMPMASITKLTLLLVVDDYIDSGKLKLDDIITGTPTAKATEGSRIWLDDGEKMTLEDILKGISIPSANDAAVALAEHISGSEEAFVKLMNEKAKELGLTNTHYVTASGLDAEGHYSSARDIAIVSKEILLNHPRIMEHSKTAEDTIRGGTFPLTNTNKLLFTYDYATGLKTGTTDGAGYCVTATAEKDGVQLIAVVLGSETTDIRFAEAKELLEYGFNNFSLVKAMPKGTVLDENEAKVYVNAIRGNKDKTELILQQDIMVFIPNEYKNKLTTEFELKEEKKDTPSLKAPFKKGTEAGTVKIFAGKQQIATATLVTATEVKKMNFFQSFIQILKAWLSF